jgi:uncharacterized peroxidase-related enzyme
MTIPEYQKLAERGGLQPVEAANLAVVSEQNASPEVAQLYAQFRENFGRPQIPGILQCFATHPPLLKHMMGLAQSMLFIDGALDRKHKEMLSAFVSAQNQCAYCADSHGFSFRVQGGSPEALDAVMACDLDSSAITAQQRALLGFARKVTNDSRDITPADIEALRSAGWSDLQIAEAIHVTALFASFNRIANGFGLPSQELLAIYEDGKGSRLQPRETPKIGKESNKG